MWLEDVLDRLSRTPVIGYAPDTVAATEPTALAALALIAHNRHPQAKPAIDFLVSSQSPDGSVGVRQKEPEPQWPTSLGVLAWQAFDERAYAANIDRAVNWILEAKGKA